jgi:rhodanese-related sulfurtransferase
MLMDGLIEIKAHKPLPERSLVTETPSAASAAAEAHFAAKLELETDPSDVHSDLMAGHQGFVVLDARPLEAYRKAHVPGAISLPYRQVDSERTSFIKDSLAVVYCWGPACNAAAKAALRLARMGFQVKEMIGGIEYWRREGYPLVAGDEPGAPVSAERDL